MVSRWERGRADVDQEGLRPRGEGAHAVLLDAVLVELEPPRQQAFRELPGEAGWSGL